MDSFNMKYSELVHEGKLSDSLQNGRYKYLTRIDFLEAFADGREPTIYPDLGYDDLDRHISKPPEACLRILYLSPYP